MSRRTADRARDALMRALAPHTGPARLIAASSKDWASALFVGSRHRLALALDGEDAVTRATAIQATLADAEIEIRGGFVADIVVAARMDGATPVLAIEALTIDEPETEAVSRAVR